MRHFSSFLLIFVGLYVSVLSYPYKKSIDFDSDLLSREEIHRAIRSLEKGVAVGDAELVDITERTEGTQRVLNMKSESRNMDVKLRPSEQLIKPSLRVLIFNDTEENEDDLDPILRLSFFHGTVTGTHIGLASLLKNINGWNGVISTNDRRYSLHSVQGLDKAVMIPMQGEDGNDSAEEEFTEYETQQPMHERIQQMKRQSDEPRLTVEIGITTDGFLYDYVKNKFGEDGISVEDKIKEMVLITMNAVHTYYQTLETKIIIEVAALNILTTTPSDIMNKKKSTVRLGKFCNWDAETNNPNGENYDVGLLFSGAKAGGPGMAMISGACRPYLSCGIGKLKSYASAIIMSHELGHTLGMVHDDNDNCRKKGYIMGAVVSKGANSFSECSSKQLNEYLQRLDNEGINCLKKETPTSEKLNTWGMLPGERLQRDEQCTIIEGEGFKENYSKSTFCSKLTCIKGRIKTSPYLGPPLPGTYCGEGKMCWQDECLEKDVVYGKVKDIIKNPYEEK